MQTLSLQTDYQLFLPSVLAQTISCPTAWKFLEEKKGEASPETAVMAFPNLFAAGNQMEVCRLIKTGLK